MKSLTGASLILVILLVSLSAYLRLAHSGIGCADWPACYGRIGPPPAEARPAGRQGDAYEILLLQKSRPLAWATPLHRLVASVLGLLIVGLNVAALRRKDHRLISMALLLLTVFLAVLGVYSGSLHDPSVVMGNLVGGFTMLALLGWMWFRQTATGQPGRAPAHTQSVFSRLAVASIVVLSIQILLGGLTSANFAATACRTLPDCHGSWLPGTELLEAMNLNREHEVTASGQAVGGAERIAIHQAHRLGAVITGGLVLLTGLFAVWAGGIWRNTGLLITGLVGLEFFVGIAAVLRGLPIELAVAHNWLAGLLLLALLSLLMKSRTIP